MAAESGKSGDRVSVDEFRALYDEVKTWGRWGDQSERGSLNELSPQRIASAAGLVREGVTVSLGLPLDTELRPDNPQPADHHMTVIPDQDVGAGAVRFAKDYVGLDYHNDSHSHIDAFSHVVYHNEIYGGRHDTITADGVVAGSIEVLSDGLVGRGVLLDMPKLRGVEWLAPGTQIRAEDLEEAEKQQGVRVGQGDVLFVRLGHSLLMRAHRMVGKAGLHPTAARFLAERRVAALGSDGNSDADPSTTEDVGFPLHVLAINAMGVPLMDYLQFEQLTATCAQLGRWDFLVVVAPLRIDGGTGSPVNPIAIF